MNFYYRIRREINYGVLKNNPKIPRFFVINLKILLNLCLTRYFLKMFYY